MSEEAGREGVSPAKPVEEAKSKAQETGADAPSQAVKEGSAARDQAASAAAKASAPEIQIEKKMGEDKSARPAASVDAKSDEKAFVLLDKAMEATDWSWKTKQGEDRELGRLSWNNAKNAWVEAAMQDPKRASEAWRKKTGEAPKADMEKMLGERVKSQKEGQSSQASGGIENLSNDLSDLSKRRDLSEQQTRKTALRSSLGEWNIMRGDSQKRREEAKRARMRELIDPEQNRGDDGFHLLKSFYKGFITHHERTQAKLEKHKSNLAAGAIREIHKEIGRASSTIKKVESELNIPMTERQSISLVGKSRQAVASSRAFRLGTGAATVLAKATVKVAEKTAEVAKHAAIQGSVLASTPGRIDGVQGNAAYHQRMEAFRQFQQSRTGMGPAS